MKIPFDIKYRPQIESGEYKVETRDGKKVRVLCYDANNIVPVVALVTFNDGSEGSRDYYSNGTMNCYRENPLDLFIVTPEPELSEFEKRVEEICNSYESGKRDSKEQIRYYAAELLDLAREEIEKEIPEMEFIPIEKTLEYKAGYRKGKADALENLPRWRKLEKGACGNGRGIPIAIVKRRLNGYELVDALGIEGEQYIMLSDLEKLPGFKEE